jgi:uncharacterized protein
MSITQDVSIPVARATVVSRKPFLQKVYLHVAIGLFIFSVASVLLQYTPVPKFIINWYASSSFVYLISLALLFGFTYVANILARSKNILLQKVGLVVYAVVEALFFTPLLLIAQSVSPLIVPISLGITLVTFGVLSYFAVQFADTFKKWKMVLVYAGIISFAAIVLSILFSFSLGIWFSYAMVLFIGGCILYETANILTQYEDEQYVAASLVLLVSLVTLFWNVIQIVLSIFDRD